MKATPTTIVLLGVLAFVAYIFFFRPPYSTAFEPGVRVGDTIVIQRFTNRTALRLAAFDMGTETATFEILNAGNTNWITKILSGPSQWKVPVAGTNLLWSGKTAGEIYLYAGDPHFESRRQLPRIAFPVDPALAVRFVQGEDIHFDWYIVAEDATPERVDNARTAIKKR